MYSKYQETTRDVEDKKKVFIDLAHRRLVPTPKAANASLDDEEAREQ